VTRTPIIRARRTFDVQDRWGMVTFSIARFPSRASVRKARVAEGRDSSEQADDPRPAVNRQPTALPLPSSPALRRHPPTTGPTAQPDLPSPSALMACPAAAGFPSSQDLPEHHFHSALRGIIIDLHSSSAYSAVSSRELSVNDQFTIPRRIATSQPKERKKKRTKQKEQEKEKENSPKKQRLHQRPPKPPQMINPPHPPSQSAD